MDFLISQSEAALNRLPLEERAKIPGALPDRLSLKDLAKLSTLDNPEKEKAILSALIEICKKDEIKCYGNIHGWEWGGGEMTYVANPYPEVRGTQVNMGNPLTTAVYNKYRAFPGDCLVHREDFKKYLEQVKQWPLNGVLVNWWPAESIEISEAIKRHNAELKKGIDFEGKSKIGPELAMPEAKQTETAKIDGTDRERTNQLHCLIWRAYQHLLSRDGKATAQQVWNEIKFRHATHDEEGIIQEVTADNIAWCSGYGNEQTLKRSSFDKTFSNLKTNPPF